jgi:hypothetical protein
LLIQTLLPRIHLQLEEHPWDLDMHWQTWLANTPEARAAVNHLAITFARGGYAPPIVNLLFPNVRTISLCVAIFPETPLEVLVDALRPLKDRITISRLQLHSYGRGVAPLLLCSILQHFSPFHIEEINLAGIKFRPGYVGALASCPPISIRADRLVCAGSDYINFREADAIALYGLLRDTTSFSLLSGHLPAPGLAALPALRTVHLDLQGVQKIRDEHLFEPLSTLAHLETLKIVQLSLEPHQWTNCLQRLPASLKNLHLTLHRSVQDGIWLNWLHPAIPSNFVDNRVLPHVVQLLDQGWLPKLETLVFEHWCDKDAAHFEEACKRRRVDGVCVLLYHESVDGWTDSEGEEEA